ncbi:hypothetical protein L873DRAFT_1804293 [Choiromyces venosus 120613-1]|uniref:Transposase Tc1-like domain-containing protein n=1 Tax=Choiromyces venosus 120613-1 TaxID=1336337 RepID=A0A3N4K4Y0_9PEZI|nr:hypothetical protein L873DRAFT_1804293 [Choiromyces venosus 120613-1]
MSGRRRLVRIREERPGASVREIWEAVEQQGMGTVGVRTVSRFLRGVEKEKKRLRRDRAISFKEKKKKRKKKSGEVPVLSK